MLVILYLHKIIQRLNEHFRFIETERMQQNRSITRKSSTEMFKQISSHKRNYTITFSMHDKKETWVVPAYGPSLNLNIFCWI